MCMFVRDAEAVHGSHITTYQMLDHTSKGWGEENLADERVGDVKEATEGAVAPTVTYK